MDNVQTLSNSEYYTPFSEPFTIYVYIDAFETFTVTNILILYIQALIFFMDH
jgi:hypothetical protein